MAKSKKPRKPYHRPNYSGEAASLNPEKYGEQARAEQSGVSESVEQAHPEPVHVDKEPVAPAHPHVTHRAPRGRGRYLVPVAAGAGVIGGGAFLAHRARRRKATMAKALVNPLTGEGVTFEKRYIEDDIDEKPHGVLVAKADSESSRAKRLRRSAVYDERFGLNPFNQANKDYRKAGMKNNFKAQGKGFVAGAAGGTAAAAAYGAARHGRSAVRGHLSRNGLAAGVLGGVTGQLIGAERSKRRTVRQLEREGKIGKRHDMAALEHTGSRRVGGRLPVSTVRVPGLPVASATFSRGNPEARPGTRSHANKVTHVHTKVKASRTGKLLLVKHGSRSKSGTSIGKSAGYAQSGGRGRRLVNV